MEFGDNGDLMKKKISFGLSVADEKIQLIDILSEDDYFLVESPFCDSFLQGSSFSEYERMEKKEQESRPSFLRRSLAWDTAFYDSAGVLDPDELSFINNGFMNSEATLLPADHEVRDRRSEFESTPNDFDFSANWFENEPSIFESKCKKELNVVEKVPKSGLKQTVLCARNIDKSCRNKMKSDPALIGKSIDFQSKRKMIKEPTIRSDNKNLSGKSNLNTDNKPVRTGLATASSSLYRRRTKTLHSPSVKTSKISGHAEKKEGMGNIGVSTHPTSLLTQPFSTPPSKSTQFFSSETLTSPVHKQRRSTDANDVKEASHLQSRQNTSAKCVTQSGLRPPSPNFRYFDENICTRNHSAVRSRKMSQQVISDESASSKIAQPRKMVKTPCSESGKYRKRLERGATDQGKELEVLCRNLGAVALDCKKSKVKNVGLSDCSAVKQEKQLLSSALASSRPYKIIPPSTTTAAATARSRTPLADKRSNCNSGKTSALQMEPKNERLVQKVSSARYHM